MPKNRKRFIGALSTTLSALYMVSQTTLAGPALYWWHEPVSMSQEECVEEARHIMPGHKNKSDGAFWSNEDVTAVVKCIDYGNQPLVVLIVTADRKDEAKRKYKALKRRMFD